MTRRQAVRVTRYEAKQNALATVRDRRYLTFVFAFGGFGRITPDQHNALLFEEPFYGPLACERDDDSTDGDFTATVRD